MLCRCGRLADPTPPLLVMNMDTAATLVAVDAEGSIVSGVIPPAQPGGWQPFGPWYATQPNCRRLIAELLPTCFLGTHNGLPAQRYCERQRPDAGLMPFARCRATPYSHRMPPVIATGTLPASIRDACATSIEYNGNVDSGRLVFHLEAHVKK